MLAVVAVMALWVPMTVQAAASKIPYSPEVVNNALANGCTVFLEFGASW